MMNKYIVFANFEKNTLDMTAAGYADEGFLPAVKGRGYCAIAREEEPKDEYVRNSLLKYICRETGKYAFGRSVCLDVSEVINKHIDRLTENEMKSLKFHDPFIDDVMVIISKLIREEEERG